MLSTTRSVLAALLLSVGVGVGVGIHAKGPAFVRRHPFGRCVPTSRVRCALDGSPLGAVVEELLNSSDDEMLGAMQRNIPAMLSPGFLGALRRVARLAVNDEDREAARRLEFSVVVFLEEFIEQVQALEKAEAEGFIDMSSMAPDLSAEVANVDRIPRRADGSNAPLSRPPRLRAPRAPPAPAAAAAAGAAAAVQSAEELLVVHRAMLQELLREAATGVNALEACLQSMAAQGQLRPPFIDHLKWEMDEQVKRGNARMLHILQLVVQRACLTMESMLDESSAAAQHLSTILQLHDYDARTDYWKRVVARLPERERSQFAQVVCSVFADVGLRVQRGMDVDDSLLRQIRLVREELDEHILV